MYMDEFQRPGETRRTALYGMGEKPPDMAARDPNRVSRVPEDALSGRMIAAA